MEPRSLQYIAHACGGTLLHGHPDHQACGICTDSRKVETQDLFVAIRGEQFDGHAFLKEAAQGGAVALLIDDTSKTDPIGDCAVIRVDDTRTALGRLAAVYRDEFNDLPIVAVAGSNGKTTTKNLLAAILKQKGHTLFSEASFNNDVGVPLSLLRLSHDHQAAVLEAGTNHPGELAPLLRMIRPSHGILTNIGAEHLEFFDDIAGVAKEERWLAELLPSKGCLFLHGDSPELGTVLEHCTARVVRVGIADTNDWQAKNLTLDLTGTQFEVHCPREDFNGTYRMRHLGHHLVSNALLALAVGAELGVTPEAACEGLATCPPSPMRMEYSEHQGVGMINDAYNANVPSMEAALQTCRELPCQGRRIAVLGDMAELGRHSEAAHRTVGQMAAAAHLDILVTVGHWADITAQAARDAGLKEIHTFTETGPATEDVLKILRPGDLVLLKASRSARLERIVSRLKDGLN